MQKDLDKSQIKKLGLPAILWLLCGCASLTGTQIRAVNQFAKTSSNFSAYPSLLVSELAQTRINRGVYFSNSLDDPKLHIEELNNLDSARRSDYKISTKVDITFKVIDKYAQSLLLLSSDKYAGDLEKQAENFGVDLDSLTAAYDRIGGVKQVPEGIGAAVNKLIVLGGKQYIKSKQSKSLKDLVPRADTLIAVMTSNLLEFLESTNIADLISNEERGINSNYLSFLRQRHATIENERDYLELKSNIDVIKTLRDETITATKHLRRAHAKLFAAITEKKTLTETIKELQELYDGVRQIKNTIGKIKPVKS